MVTLLPSTPPDEALRHTAPFVRDLSVALDEGVSWTELLYPDPISDPGFRTYAIRAYGLTRLRQRATSGAWAVTKRRLSNSGIEVQCGPFIVRVLKAIHGAPPAPGRNAARLEFYSQTDERLAHEDLQLPLNLTDPPSGLNLATLIVDWDVDQQRRLSLALSKPVATWTYGEQPRFEWRRRLRIEHDMPSFVPPEEDVEVQPLFDPGDLSAQSE